MPDVRQLWLATRIHTHHGRRRNPSQTGSKDAASHRGRAGAARGPGDRGEQRGRGDPAQGERNGQVHRAVAGSGVSQGEPLGRGRGAPRIDPGGGEAVQGAQRFRDEEGHLGVPRARPFLGRPPKAMTPAFEKLQKQLKALPGLGHRSSERIALNLLVEKPERLPALVEALEEAARSVRRCARCGNLAEGELCAVCSDARRDASVVCVVEHVPDLVALERSAAYRGVYQVLQGKLSPMHGVGPSDLNIAPLVARVEEGSVQEVILALSNDVEGEATCHYLTQ